MYYCYFRIPLKTIFFFFLFVSDRLIAPNWNHFGNKNFFSSKLICLDDITFFKNYTLKINEKKITNIFKKIFQKISQPFLSCHFFLFSLLQFRRTESRCCLLKFIDHTNTLDRLLINRRSSGLVEFMLSKDVR